MQPVTETVDVDGGKCNITSNEDKCMVMAYDLPDGCHLPYFYLNPQQAENLAKALLKFVERAQNVQSL